jgi:hypothetical protein
VGAAEPGKDIFRRKDMESLLDTPVLSFLVWWQYIAIVVLIVLIIVYFQMRKKQM